MEGTKAQYLAAKVRDRVLCFFAFLLHGSSVLDPGLDWIRIQEGKVTHKHRKKSLSISFFEVQNVLF
jgi:hypothetical protein